MTNFFLPESVWTFLTFFLTGLAVNLTPCVYPMLTVTASLFKSRQTQAPGLGYSFLKAACYVLGIAVMYSALGYFAASTGKLFGSVLQNKWVLTAVASLMFVLAASMFGLFQLRVPVGLLNRLGGARKADFFGLFLSGMLVGVFAAPCVGPPVIALLAAVAENGSPSFGLSAFFIFSLGLGFPYLILGTFSGLIPKLPKAGIWLVWVERLFGVVLAGLGVFYLLLAFKIDLPRDKTDLIWKTYTIEAEQNAVRDKRPVVIDLYADWCIECHAIEKTIFSQPEVKARLAQVAALRVDATNFDDPKIQEVIERYEIIGLPTVLFLDDKGHEIRDARMEGAGTKEEFLRSLDKLAEANDFIFK